jgi:hypothetical protein
MQLIGSWQIVNINIHLDMKIFIGMYIRFVISPVNNYVIKSIK